MLSETKVGHLLDQWTEEYANMLTQWVQIPSVKAAPCANAPFGENIRTMLDRALKDASSMGFSVRDFNGYAGDITLGDESLKKIAILGHLDVVPVGDGWNYPPFGAVRVGNKIFGRGTSDDKGPALAALFAMRALKEAGIALKKGIRLILGCDEESGWECMDWYCAHTEMPDVGFSPDATFPMINTEKGMVHMWVSAPVSTSGLQVKHLYTGERLNVIAGESTAVLAGGTELIDQIDRFASDTGLDYHAELSRDGVTVTAHGIPGHSAMPNGRRSAIGMMLILLRHLGVEGSIKTLADAWPMEHDGKHLGIACSDEISGPLTCNMGVLHLENGRITASLDCRCPISSNLDLIAASIKEHLPGFTIDHLSTTQAHHVPADSELVTSLLDAYHEETGLPAYPESTGGGTYAKVLKHGVAFGACFPGDPDLAHQANEYIEIPKMILSAKVYAAAILKLCAE